MEPLKSINEAFDKFTEDQITKLISTWNKHKILKIAVDFDSTIFPWNENEASTCTYVIYLLKKAKKIWSSHNSIYL